MLSCLQTRNNLFKRPTVYIRPSCGFKAIVCVKYFVNFSLFHEKCRHDLYNTEAFFLVILKYLHHFSIWLEDCNKSVGIRTKSSKIKSVEC